MPPTPCACGSVRSVAEWNEAIRQFWQGLAGEAPTPAEQVEYQRLLAGWAAARGDVVQAA